MHISWNLNDKMSDKLVILERNATLLNSPPEENASKYRAFLLKLGDKDIEIKVLEILDAIDVHVNMDLVEECHQKVPPK